MPELSLSAAAKLTGKSKSTINRAIKSGKLSANRGNDGSYLIDPAELSRVFVSGTPEPVKRTDSEPHGTHELELRNQRIEALEAALAREREVTEDLKEDRDRWRQQATALLTDRREQTNKPSSRRKWRFW